MILIFSGCSLNGIGTNPEKAMSDIIAEKYGEANILYQNICNEYVSGIFEKGDDVTLVILEKAGDKYEFFGSSSYDKNKASYGMYNFVNEDNLLVVFAENTNFKYESLTINYFNKTDSNETLEIKDIVETDQYICNMYLLPSCYQYKNLQLY